MLTFFTNNGDEDKDTGKQENQTAPDSYFVFWSTAIDESVLKVTLNQKSVSFS